MDIIKFRDFCMGLPLTEETTPFDEDTLVYKVCGKMYAFTSIGSYEWICVKNHPDKISLLLETDAAVKPAYHMNKRHWIDISTSGAMSDPQLKRMILESYLTVINGLPRAQREQALEIAELSGVINRYRS